MSNQTLIHNHRKAFRKAHAETLREAGYPPLATHTENELAALCDAQTEELGECQRQRDDTLDALRTLVNVIEQGHSCPAAYLDTASLQDQIEKLLSIAKGALEKMEDG